MKEYNVHFTDHRDRPRSRYFRAPYWEEAQAQFKATVAGTSNEIWRECAEIPRTTYKDRETGNALTEEALYEKYLELYPTKAITFVAFAGEYEILKMTRDRISKENYYLDIAQTVSERSTCIRRRFGAVIVKNDSIISTGYNGAPRGRANCNELGSCYRDTLGIPRGERYELCRSVHAEANAIIAAPREQMLGATIYMCCTSPENGSVMAGTTSCMMCKRLIINAGIERLVVRDDALNFRIINVSDWIDDDDSLGGKLGY